MPRHISSETMVMLSLFSGHLKVFGNEGGFFESDSESSRSFCMSLSICSIRRTCEKVEEEKEVAQGKNRSYFKWGGVNGWFKAFQISFVKLFHPLFPWRKSNHHAVFICMNPWITFAKNKPAAMVRGPRRGVPPCKGPQQCLELQMWWQRLQELTMSRTRCYLIGIAQPYYITIYFCTIRNDEVPTWLESEMTSVSQPPSKGQQ